MDSRSNGVAIVTEGRLLTWTDIHSHILPGFDDGASDEEEFLEMARVAVEGGTRLMAATPHYDCEQPSFEPAAVAAAVEGHNRLLEEEGIPLLLVAGLEVRINAGLLYLAKSAGLRELSIGGAGNYMLVDLPLSDMPLATPDILFQVQLRGITPILAHPERNRYLVEHPRALGDLVERGIEVQVDSGSLQGLFGRQAERAARLLIEKGTARLVASDAHSPGGRNPDMSGAAWIVGSLIGNTAPGVLMEGNPGSVLDGWELSETISHHGGKSERSRKRSWGKSR